MALGHGFASRLRTARHVAIRPPLLGGLVVAVIILGVIVWLAVAGRDQGAATDGQQVRIPLQQEEHEAAPAPGEEAEDYQLTRALDLLRGLRILSSKPVAVN